MFRFGLLQDGDVGIWVFLEREEIIISVERKVERTLVQFCSVLNEP